MHYALFAASLSSDDKSAGSESDGDINDVGTPGKVVEVKHGLLTETGVNIHGVQIDKYKLRNLVPGQQSAANGKRQRKSLVARYNKLQRSIMEQHIAKTGMYNEYYH